MRILMNRCCSAPSVTNMICRTYNAACRVVKPAQASASRAAVCSHGLSACPGSAVLQSKAPLSTRVYSSSGWSDSGGGDDYSDRQFDRRSDRDYSDRDDRSSYRGRGGGGRRDSYGRGGRGGRSSGGRGGRGRSSTSNELQPGDWACPECNYRNFGRNTTCRECDTPRPEDYVPQVRAPREPREIMEGDWNCTACGQHNYASRIKCFVCGESAPEEVLAARPTRDNYNRSATDWECTDCGEVNFARRDTCRACSAPRPEGAGGGERESYGDSRGRRDYGDSDRRSYGDSRGRRDYGDRGDRREYAPRERREYAQREPREYVAKEGDWTCPSCGDVNYAFRSECRKCQAPKP